MDRYKIPIGIHLLLRRGEEVLLIRRFNTGYADGKYGLPSGHLESGEWALDGIAREAREEVGIAIETNALQLAHTIHKRPYGNDSAGSGIVALFFIADRWEGEPRNMEPDKCDRIGWFRMDDLPEETIPFIKQAIDNYRKGIVFSQFDGN